MTLVRMCVVCGAKAIPFMKTEYGDPLCSPECYRELQSIIEVMTEGIEEEVKEHEQNTTFPSSLLRDFKTDI